MPLDFTEKDFKAGRPWHTLLNLYRPERRWVLLAMITYLFKASPLWVLPVITASIIAIVVHRNDDGMRSLWINAIIGVVIILQNVLSAIIYMDFLSPVVRNVEIRMRSALVRRLQELGRWQFYRTEIFTFRLLPAHR